MKLKSALIIATLGVAVAACADNRNLGDSALSGRLPLPTEYPLMPQDELLWPNLTAAQQHRAVRFLASGSTIRSSLQPD